MELNQIRQTLSDVLIGTSVLSMKLAGPELEIFFIGSRLSTSGIASIDTDAWIFVGNRNDFEPTKISDDEFFKQRASAIVGLYELTGYGVEAVEINTSGVLQLRIGEKDVVIYPTVVNLGIVEPDSWTLIVERDGKKTGYIHYDAGRDFFVREP
jgi:hypothetical protein